MIHFLIYCTGCCLWTWMGFQWGQRVTAKKLNARFDTTAEKVSKIIAELIYRNAALSSALNSVLDSYLPEDKAEATAKAMKLLEEVNEITKVQLSSVAALEGPSKGAAFSRHRNGVIAELKEMDRLKNSKLQEILDMGLDPKVSVLIDGKEEKRRLSEVMAEFKNELNYESPDKSKDDKSKRHLSVIKE